MRLSWNPRDISGTWYEAYRQSVFGCNDCSARRECKRPVPGEGNLDAKLMFVGRNPGETEDRTGRPFVGKAGAVFDQMLLEFEVERPSIFVTNLYLCKTHKNRLPGLHEVRACVPKYLFWTLREIKPKVVVSFGQCTNYYMNGLKKMVESHGKVLWNKRFGFWVIPSIHPASVCYEPRMFYRLQEIMRTVDQVLRR